MLYSMKHILLSVVISSFVFMPGAVIRATHQAPCGHITAVSPVVNLSSNTPQENGPYALLRWGQEAAVTIGSDVSANPAGVEVSLARSPSPLEDRGAATISPAAAVHDCASPTGAAFSINADTASALAPNFKGVSVPADTNGLYFFDVLVAGEPVDRIFPVTFIEERRAGTLIRSEGFAEVFVINEGKRKHIGNPAIFEGHAFRWEDVVTVTQKEEFAYRLDTSGITSLFTGDGGDTWFVFEDKWLYQDTADARTLFPDLVPRAVERIASALRRGELMRVQGDAKVYAVTERNTKRHILTEEVFDAYGYQWEDVIVVPEGWVAFYADNVLIRGAGENKVYKLEGGQKRWIQTPEAFTALEFEWDAVATVNQAELAAWPTGPDMK